MGTGYEQGEKLHGDLYVAELFAWIDITQIIHEKSGSPYKIKRAKILSE